MHITNQLKLSFDIENLQNIFMKLLLNILLIFSIKEKSIIFDPYNVFLATYDWFCGPGSHIHLYPAKFKHKLKQTGPSCHSFKSSLYFSE
ncbi:Phosphoribosyl-AMP cyclohydrolase [Labeo rohita]|uniref:Phosphoribosyl-AMP cyclohydrolase n=1 Tax=Labeo rohita TaxID=84645 RepID=A0ABQ8MEE4_LABRO|nr:Phosphoribosyl-AMP cyclohydrolase [Labeo rohita]